LSVQAPQKKQVKLLLLLLQSDARPVAALVSVTFGVREAVDVEVDFGSTTRGVNSMAVLHVARTTRNIDVGMPRL
jgi:hypothetical protein